MVAYARFREVGLKALVEAAIVAPEDRARLLAAFPLVNFVFADDERAWLEAAPAAEVIFAKAVRPTALDRAGRLRWVQAGTAGVEGWLRSGILARGVRLTNARGAHGVPIAEQVLAMALCFASRLALLLRAQPAQPGVAARVIAEKFELEGQTMLVVGLGDIGGTLAQKAGALGMRVLGVRRSGQPHPHCAAVHRPDHLAALLPEADHLALCLPLTPETDGLIGERELRRMKASAYLYNVGRGATVDGAALRRALAEG